MVVDYNVSSDNVSLDELDEIVKKYASKLGIDASSGVQFLQLLSDTQFNDAGFNKYNLSETDINTLQQAIDDKKSAEYIDLLMKDIFAGREQALDTTNMTESEFAGYLQEFANGKSIEEIMADAGFQDLDRDYASGAGRKVPVYENGKPKFENGLPVTESFTTHFNTDFHYILNSLSDDSDIREFQKYLIENRVVSPDTFLGTEGEYSSALEAAIVMVMRYLDTEHYIAEGTEQWNQIMESDPVFFSQQQYGDYVLDANGIPVPSPEGLKRTQDVKLFNWAVQEINKDYSAFAEYNEQMADEQLINQLKSQYQVLTPLQREDEVQSWFELKLGRKGSKEEIEKWANNIALNYSSVFKKLVKDAQNLQQDVGLRDWEQNYLATFGTDEKMDKKSFAEMTNISAQLAQEDALLQAEDRFEDVYAGQMEAHEIGKQAIQQDMDILRMIYG